jgi:hypothetical protein
LRDTMQDIRGRTIPVILTTRSCTEWATLVHEMAVFVSFAGTSQDKTLHELVQELVASNPHLWPEMSASEHWEALVSQVGN